MITQGKRKWLFIVAGSIGVLFLAYILGPKPSRPDFSSIVIPSFSTDLKVLEDSLNRAEASLPIKPDNQARIVWATPYQKTPYSMVYLHGNMASQEEGDPIHEALADRYGCNLFLARLNDHGLQEENPMLDIDPVEWMQSALDAIAIGKAIGEKVILISCSTGSTFALYLASKYPDLVEAQVMFSPNIDYYDSRSWMMTLPWGLQLSRKIIGSDFYGWDASAPAKRYWHTRYRIEGLITLKAILDETMTEETFKKINDPLFLSYYYRDETHQDKVVSVKRMKEMFSQLGTPAEMKTEVILADAGTHIIASDLFNSQIESLWKPTIEFCEQIVKLVPVKDSDWKLFLDFRQTN